MGGCATKPKVLKGDEGPGEVPSPSPPKEAVPEAKEAAAADQGEDKVESDKVTDDNIDDQSNKKRSLSNLFNEKENKGTAESDNTQSEAEPVKKETLESVPKESPDTVKQELEPVTKNQDNTQSEAEPVKKETLESVPKESPDAVKQELEPVIKNQDNTQSEAGPVKKKTLESVPQESPDTVKQELEPVTKNQETEKPVEPVSLPPGNIESEKPNEAKPAPEAAPTAAVVNVPETQNRETPAGETKDKTVVAN